MSNVIDLQAYRQRKRPQCPFPGCDQPAEWFTEDHQAYACNNTAHHPYAALRSVASRIVT